MAARNDEIIEVCKWFNEIEMSLTSERHKLEKLFINIKKLSSQKQKTKLMIIDDKNETTSDQSLDVEHEIQKKEESINMNEIDKVLEKAKSLRVHSDEPTNKKSSQKMESKSATAKHEIQVGQKRPSANAKSTKSVTSSRGTTKSVRGSARAKPLHRPRQMTSAKGSQGAKAKVEDSCAVDVPSLRSDRSSTDVVARDIKLPIPESKDFNEIHLEDKTIVDKEVIDCCLKIRNLKDKVSRLISNPSSATEDAKMRFLNCVESSFGDSIPDFHDMTASMTSEARFLRKYANHGLDGVSPLMRILSSLRWEKTFSDIKQLQELFQQILNLQELIIDHQGKEYLLRLCVKIFQSGNLAKSEKISANRKFYGLLLSNGKRLPAMIDDSEVYDFEDDDFEDDDFEDDDFEDDDS